MEHSGEDDHSGRSAPSARETDADEWRRATRFDTAQRKAHSTYAETSTGELARESEITELMLYKHFGSKKGLFLAVLAEFGGQFFVALQENIERRAEKDLLDALAHVIDDYRLTIRTDSKTMNALLH